MENDPSIDDFSIKTSLYSGFSMAMLNNQMVSATSPMGTLNALTLRRSVIGFSPDLTRAAAGNSFEPGGSDVDNWDISAPRDVESDDLMKLRNR